MKSCNGKRTESHNKKSKQKLFIAALLDTKQVVHYDWFKSHKGLTYE